MSATNTTDKVLLGGKARVLACRGIADERGTLVPLHFEPLGFQARRMALISAPDGGIRGGHAHREGTQLLLCVSGSVDVTLHHQGDRARVTLEPGVNVLLIEAPVWAEQAYHGDSPRLLMLSDVDFSPDLYTDSPAKADARIDA